MDAVTGVLEAVVPTLCAGALFWFVMRAILRSDRTERAAQAKVEAELDAEFARAHEPHDS